ncbi:MAG TPA: STAS domain-containing protein [Candidatus Binatia bacterium]|nr:STAS domain-containing protein [Candidatus Binatia bacterium]
MAFELQVASLREIHPQRRPALRGQAAFLPAARIELVGELNERSSALAAERIDAEVSVESSAVLISLDGVTVPHWAALCHLVAKIQSARRRGYDVRVVRPKPSIRLLLGAIALGASDWVEADDVHAARSVVIA